MDEDFLGEAADRLADDLNERFDAGISFHLFNLRFGTPRLVSLVANRLKRNALEVTARASRRPLSEQK